MTEPATAERVDLGRNVSQIVRILMALRGWDQAELASRIGKSPSSISKLLAGNLRWSLDDLARLADTFDYPVGLFFEPAEQLVRNRCFREPEQLVLDLESTLSEHQRLRLAPPFRKMAKPRVTRFAA